MDVLHADDQVVVVNKPAGLSVLVDGWQPDAPYLVKLLEDQFGPIFVVHRLDKVTSGVMVLARAPEAHRLLNIQFQRHEVNKLYHAIVTGRPRWEAHIARHPLRVDVGHRHRTIVDATHGRPCETRFTVLKLYPTQALLAAIPRTGRTHQVRAHACALGHPLISDSLYGGQPSELIARPALHALSLSFVHPATGEAVTFEAPYPVDFAGALASLERLPAP